MLSALLMFRRVARAWRYAVRRRISSTCSAPAWRWSWSGLWSTRSTRAGTSSTAVYFAVSTLTTTRVSDPDLMLDQGWVKIFTVLYQLIGIGILVEILRRLGAGFVVAQAEERDG
jgi:hypothetical protein